MSRAFGDRLLKKYVVAEPDILDTALTGGDTLLIMATDGLWDVVSNQDAISMVRVSLPVSTIGASFTPGSCHPSYASVRSILFASVLAMTLYSDAPLRIKSCGEPLHAFKLSGFYLRSPL